MTVASRSRARECVCVCAGGWEGEVKKFGWVHGTNFNVSFLFVCLFVFYLDGCHCLHIYYSVAECFAALRSVLLMPCGWSLGS